MLAVSHAELAAFGRRSKTLFQNIPYTKNHGQYIYIRKGKRRKRRRDESSDFPKVIRGERSQVRRGPNTGRYQNDRFRCSSNCYSYAWTSPQPKFPNRFWISSVRFRAGVSNFIRPLNSRPTWLQLACKISPRANCRETISAATMCIEIRTVSMPPNRRLASPASGFP